jgi:hypothetical protein
MLMTLLLGGIAGWGAGFAEDHIRRVLAQALSVEEDTFKPAEMRSIALVLSLLVAALVSWIIATPSAVALMLGATLAVLLPRIKDMIRAARTPDYDE